MLFAVLLLIKVNLQLSQTQIVKRKGSGKKVETKSQRNKYT